jgi:ankyrin repeat protein
MRVRFVIMIVVTASAVPAGLAQSLTPPPLLARPRAVYYPHGINGAAVPVPDLYESVLQNDKERARDLLERGANPNEVAPNGDVPLIAATVWGKDPEICRLLVAHGADVNVVTKPNAKGWSNKWTPLFYAVYRKRSELVAILLTHGARTNLKDEQGKSPMDWAKEVKSDEIVKQLKAVGAR